MFYFCGSSHRSRAARMTLGFIRSTAAVATVLFAGHADAVDYVVNDEDICLAFLTGIGAGDEDLRRAGLAASEPVRLAAGCGTTASTKLGR